LHVFENLISFLYSLFPRCFLSHTPSGISSIDWEQLGERELSLLSHSIYLSHKIHTLSQSHNLCTLHTGQRSSMFIIHLQSHNVCTPRK
jgi:hypothetical protein